MGPKGPSAKGEEMTLEERVRRIEKWLTSNSAAEMISIKGAIRASLDAPRAEAEPAPAERTVEAGGEPAPTERANAKRLTIREAARNRQPLGGADAQALEGALAQADRERDSLRAERDKARAEVERIMGLLHDKAWMLAACLTIAEGGSARANEPTYLNSPAMDAVRDVVRERDSLRAERDAEQRRAMAAESERDVLREEHTARVLENSDLAHERDEAREERDSLRAQLDECQRVLALGEKVDAITKEKIARLERGVREAKVLLESVHMFFSSDDWKARFAWLKEFGS